MASFFRKRIAYKVLSMLQKRQELNVPSTPNLISTLVKINNVKSSQPQLILPWKSFEKICDQNIEISPKELVRLLRNQGLPTAEGFTDIQLSESPYLSLIFTVDKHVFSKIVLVDICTNDDDDFAKSSCLFEDIEKKNIVVQCSLPPIGGSFHLTHFRTVIHSNYVANINKFVGHNVTKIAHVNDWGPDAAALLTGYRQHKVRDVQKKNLFDFPEIRKAALSQYNNNLKFKQDSDFCYEKMKQGDISTISEWQELKQRCIDYYDSIFQKIGTHFDDLYFDSACIKKSEEISDQLLDNNLINIDTGITASSDELEDNIYRNSAMNMDSALYNFSRHISAAIEMKEIYGFDKMFYVTPSSEKDFFSVLFYLMKKLNFEWVSELHPVNLQLIINSQKKNRTSIDVLLNVVKEGMITKLHEKLQVELNESLEEWAENLSVSSLIVNDMKHRRKVDYNFDWKDIISFKKDTAASFQLCSAGLKGLQEDSEYIFNNDIDLSPLVEREAHYLIQQLARFDEIVFKSYTYLEPCIIVQYLSSLWYFTDKVTNCLTLDIKSDRLMVIKARLMLLAATLRIFNKALLLLGITPLEKAYSSKPFVQSI